MNEKVTQSVYMNKELRARLLRHAAKEQEQRGERVSVNAVIVSAIEAWLASYDALPVRDFSEQTITEREIRRRMNEKGGGISIAELFTCPRCEARRDERCATPGGRYREPHMERIRKAQEKASFVTPL